jgi:hypothetical protein
MRRYSERGCEAGAQTMTSLLEFINLDEKRTGRARLTQKKPDRVVGIIGILSDT